MSDQQTIKVWDILVRFFHWSLVVAFTISYISQDEESLWHIYSGYTVLGLVLFRLVWGVIGTRYARFTNFLYSPTVVLGYLKGLVTPHRKHYIGHNPAGGWMIMALLMSLLVVTLSGLKLYAVEEGKGPLAGISPDLSLIQTAYANDDDDDHRYGHEGREHEDDEEGEEFWEEIHEASANFTLLLIILHIAGVVVSSRLHNENLVRAMITGKKSRPSNSEKMEDSHLL